MRNVYIFGFSSGGLAAQMLAQILENIGIPMSLKYQPDGIWEVYQAWYSTISGDKQDKGDEDARRAYSDMIKFRLKHRRLSCRVAFLGLFDSVNITPGVNMIRGVNIKKWNTLQSVVTHPALVVRHAVAIDERQPALRPNLANKMAGCKHDIEELWFPGGHAVSISQSRTLATHR
jgi:uncharacterized protein (DUF2235 family)